MKRPSDQFVFLASVDWDAAWQRHQVLASSFAENYGNEVFFVENTGLRGLRMKDASRVLSRLESVWSPKAPARAERKLKVVSPAVLPPTLPLFRKINRRWLLPRLVRELGARGLKPDPVVFAYLPTDTTLALLDAIKPGLLVYDCVDNFSGHTARPRDLEATETALLKRADLVLATSNYLYEKCRRHNANTHELHHGVSEVFFQPKGAPEPGRYRRFCYFGTVWSALDYQPIAALAEAGFEITLIGPVKEAPLSLPKTVSVRGAVPLQDLPRVLTEFDGYLLPYADTLYNQGVVPAKTFECLASGKPVLATPIPELKRFENLFYLAKNPQEWVKIASRLSDTETKEKREARIALAKEHSTQIQIEKICRLLLAAAGR